jgi:hypothetical protein
MAGVAYQNYRISCRRAKLMAKYNDAVLVDKLMANTIWYGQTADQLLDSIGKPAYIKHFQLLTKDKKELSYNQCGKGKYKTTIIIERVTDQYQVVGWRTPARLTFRV